MALSLLPHNNRHHQMCVSQDQLLTPTPDSALVLIWNKFDKASDIQYLVLEYVWLKPAMSGSVTWEKNGKESENKAVYWLCAFFLFLQRSWMEVCTLTRTSSCVMQTQSIGRTLSKTQESIQWWCPQTAVSHVSITQQAWACKTRRFDLTPIHRESWEWPVTFRSTHHLWAYSKLGHKVYTVLKIQGKT